MRINLPFHLSSDVHRLGRTARAGAKGQGILLLADFELPFLRTPDMRPLPLKPLATSSNDASALAQCHQILRAALLQVGDDIKAQAYQAFLGYYKGSMRLCGFDTTTLIQTANYYAQHVLLYQGGGDNVETPPLLAKTVGMMGLKGAPGLNIVKALPGKETGGGGGRGNGRGSTARGGAGGGRSQQGPGSRANGHIVPGSGMDGQQQQQQQRTTGPTRGGGGRGRGGARRGGPPS
jgi:ATP-dependent RNA helicase MSS116, mitochondrial